MIDCGALASMALVACLARDPACLPPWSPEDRAQFLPLVLSTVRQESAGQPYVIRNEAERRGVLFQSKDAAVAYAVAADARGVTIGLGLGQLTHRSNWLRHTGTTGRAAIEALLDPCRNLRATAEHWQAAWRAAVAYNAGPGRIGNPPAPSAAYASRVVEGAAAAQVVETPAAPQARPCPLPSPPAADAWGVTRHAMACARLAQSTPEGTAN